MWVCPFGNEQNLSIALHILVFCSLRLTKSFQPWEDRMGILYLELYIRVTIAKTANIHVMSTGIHSSQLHAHCRACLEIKPLCGHAWDGFPLGETAADGEERAWSRLPLRHKEVQCTLGCVRRCPLEAVGISQIKEHLLGTRNAQAKTVWSCSGSLS